jgi:O-antigen/teichoic acid export membrane protein
VINFLKTYLQQNKVQKRFIENSLWSISGALFSRGAMLIITIIIARSLGKVHYGEYSIIQSTINMFISLSGFGLGISATKYVSEFKYDNPAKTGKIISSALLLAFAIGLISSLIVYTFSPIISNSALNASYLTGQLRIGSIIIFFATIVGVQTGVLSGFEDFKSISKINVFSTFLFFPIQIVFTIIWKLEGSVLGYGIFFIILTLLNSILLTKKLKEFNIKLKLKNCFEDYAYLWKFSFPAFLSTILVIPILWYCNSLLVSNSNGFEEMAIFNAANQWQTIILFIPSAIAQVSLPVFVSQRNNKVTLLSTIKRNVFINFVLCLSLAILFSIASKPIMHSYGHEYKEGFLVLIILSFSGVLNAVNIVIGQVLTSLNKMWIGLLLNLIWALLLILFTIYFISIGYGALGLAFAMLIAYALHTVNTWLAVKFYYN